MLRARYGRAAAPRWMKDWRSLSVGTAFTNVAAGVTTGLAVITGLDDPATLIRVVGNVSIIPQADVTMIVHMGLYWSDRTGLATLVPSTSGDITRHNWMWWTARARSPTGESDAMNIPIDIRVKRKLQSENDVIFAIYSLVAYSYVVNLRGLLLEA